MFSEAENNPCSLQKKKKKTISVCNKNPVSIIIFRYALSKDF
jgi:hypothetical protein